MSKSSDAFVGAFGMKARNRGLSIEIDGGREVLREQLKHLARVVAVLVEQPAIAAAGSWPMPP